MLVDHSPPVDEIRIVARRLVRELGFTGSAFAGTDLPPSAVHALIEIEAGGATARDLAQTLRLEKSSVSRMLRRLIEAGDVETGAGAGDARLKPLTLTNAGKRRVGAIHGFARAQVRAALARLRPGEAHRVLEGLSLYADALAGRAEASTSPIMLKRGYQPALVGRVTLMHARYYAQVAGFGQRFECVVAAGLAAFCERLENPRNAIWVAMRDGEIVGSLAIDAEDLGPGVAHLRWFIVDEAVRGSGTGRRLLEAALAFVDEEGFDETRLWTFEGLAAARHLYERSGFTLMTEHPGTQWGSEVLEQCFRRPHP